MPSSRTVGRAASSTSRVHKEYSDCKALIGCTAFDRRVPVDAVLVVEIDHIDAEPPQGRLACQLDVLRAAVDAHPAAVWIAHVAELRREDDAIATIRDCMPHEFFVAADAVGISGVEQRHSELDRAVDRCDRLRVVRIAVELRHPHAAEALPGNLESL